MPLELMASARRITVLTGAGISTDSGIPDYRGPQGVWTRNPAAAAMATLDKYVNDPALRRRSWQSRREHPAFTAEPNVGHRALVDLEQAGLLRTIVTQNIDGLHQKAGSTRVIEIHGTMWYTQCLSCENRTPMDQTLARVDAGEDDPPCELCGGILKSATISFGQSLDREVLQAAVDAVRDCDLLIAIGTSLTVYPAAGLIDVALEAGARVVIVNAEPTPYDPVADAVVREPIGTSLPAMVAAALGRVPDDGR
jgi:NAD-dependent deacetylase